MTKVFACGCGAWHLGILLLCRERRRVIEGIESIRWLLLGKLRWGILPLHTFIFRESQALMQLLVLNFNLVRATRLIPCVLYFRHQLDRHL